MRSTATSLSDVMAGRAVAPGDSDWDRARRAFNPSATSGRPLWRSR